MIPANGENDWSNFGFSDWFAVFIGGFFAMFLFFFRFYAGVFAAQILVDRGVPLPQLSRIALSGTLPLIFAAITSAGLGAGMVFRRNPFRRAVMFWGAVGVGFVGVVATLVGVYGPLVAGQ